MKKDAKPNPEFDNFTGFMDKLAKVPHSELKEKLEEEKKAKQNRRQEGDDDPSEHSTH